MPRLSQTRRDLLNSLMKDTIFEATTTVLCQHGVDGTTMNRVAEAAGLAKSSLYDYFSSKNELLVFAVNRMFAPTVEAFRGDCGMELPAAEKLRRIAHQAFASVEKHRGLLVAVHARRSSRRDRVSRLGAFVRRSWKPCRRYSRREWRTGICVRKTSRRFHGCFIGMSGEMCELWLASDPPEPVEQRVETLLRVFLGGMLASPAKDAFQLSRV